MRRVTEEFSGDFNVLRLLMHTPPLCTYYELEHVYTLEDMYNMLEMIDVQSVLKEQAQLSAERQAEKNKIKK